MSNLLNFGGYISPLPPGSIPRCLSPIFMKSQKIKVSKLTFWRIKFRYSVGWGVNGEGFNSNWPSLKCVPFDPSCKSYDLYLYCLDQSGLDWSSTPTCDWHLTKSHIVFCFVDITRYRTCQFTSRSYLTACAVWCTAKIKKMQETNEMQSKLNLNLT